MTLLLRSYAGSILHGMSTPESDTDIVEVYSSPFPVGRDSYKNEIQSIEDGLDLTRLTLSRFMERASVGSHQALDAMFSNVVEVDKISALRHGFIAGSNAIPVFIGTIRELAHQDFAKKHRHAARIALNLKELAETGRYEPTLTPEKIEVVQKMAALPTVEFKIKLQEMVPFYLGLRK